MTSERIPETEHSNPAIPGKSGHLRGESGFVRGEGELAVYRERWQQTGHVLTRWEAIQAYGEATINEALEYGSAILKETKTSTKDALASRRENLGLTTLHVARAARVSQSAVEQAESTPAVVDIDQLERIAFVLGLDERFVAFRSDCGGDADLGLRLKTLQLATVGNTPSISPAVAVLLAETASVIRTQHRLQDWLNIRSELDRFQKSNDYGSYQNPAWRVGYSLARDARAKLGLDNQPITSMRELVEKRLGIPVIQASMNPQIAGATVTNTDAQGNEVRGVLLNISGDNDNVWVRRATLAHELGHLLYDPEQELKKVRVDSYSASQSDPQTLQSDYVEQRANAFAIAFLAPVEAVAEMTAPPIKQEDVDNVMSTFGISHTAARYHIGNCHYRQYDVPEGSSLAIPSDEQRAAENFSVDYFPLEETADQRRGKFSGLVAATFEEALISEDTAAEYLQCERHLVSHHSQTLRDLFEI